MVIFNSYVNLPEGKPSKDVEQIMVDPWKHELMDDGELMGETNHVELLWDTTQHRPQKNHLSGKILAGHIFLVMPWHQFATPKSRLNFEGPESGSPLTRFMNG